MKFLYCCILLLLSFKIAFAQISPSDSKKISKILGENFVELTPQKSYPYSSLNENVIADTSLVVPNDTTGIYFNNEFLLFRSAIHFKLGSEVKKMMSTSYVTVAEYQEFQNYVRDSIAREIIFFGLQDDRMVEKWVLFNKKYASKNKIESSDRIKIRESFPLNWNKKFTYNDWENEQIMPLLEELYLKSKNQYYKNHDFDENKFLYLYTELSAEKTEHEIPIKVNRNLWLKKSLGLRDDLHVLSQTYEKLFENLAIVGLNYSQLLAFLNWKNLKIQDEFNSNNIKYELFLTTPQISDILQAPKVQNEIIIAKKDFTKTWQIANEEYGNFVEYVKDSIVREICYLEVADDQKAASFISYLDRYYDPHLLCFVDFDPSDRKGNRGLFNLNYSTKIDVKDKELQLLLSNAKQTATIQNPKFKYFYKDYKYDSTYLVNNLNPKIVKVETPILPDSTSTETQIIKKISYEQALAFYHWKYPIHKIKATDNWQDFVLPSKEQFEKIQHGEQIIVEEKKLEFPSPVFRYVVHIFPKN